MTMKPRRKDPKNQIMKKSSTPSMTRNTMETVMSSLKIKWFVVKAWRRPFFTSKLMQMRLFVLFFESQYNLYYIVITFIRSMIPFSLHRKLSMHKLTCHRKQTFETKCIERKMSRQQIVTKRPLKMLKIMTSVVLLVVVVVVVVTKLVAICEFFGRPIFPLCL